MVAKIPLSRSRLITSLARASSFSESSLIAIPSLMVILRVIGTSSGTAGRGGAMEGDGPRRIMGGCGRPYCGRPEEVPAGGYLLRRRRDATKWDAWGEAHPGAGMELAAPAQVSASPHADKSADWKWVLRAGPAVVADAFPLVVANPGVAEGAYPDA